MEKEILEDFSKVLHLDSNTKSCALKLFNQYSIKTQSPMVQNNILTFIYLELNILE